MDEYTDMPDGSGYTEDSSEWDDYTEPMEDDFNGHDVSDPSLEDLLKDILDGYFAPDGDDPEADEEAGEETDGDAAEGDEEDILKEGAGGGESVFFDSEVLSEINDTLHQHADDVSGFMSDITVSGNSVMVSLDEVSAAMLRDTMANQEEVIERIDYMSELIVLVLFVLLFDLIHRFAKRIIKNFMRGDEKNAAGT